MSTFRCATIGRDLTTTECVQRQDKRLKDGSGTRPPGHQHCDPETCATGRAHRDALEQERRDDAASPLADLELDEGLDELLDAFDLSTTADTKTETREAELLVPPPATPVTASAAEPVPEPAQGKPDRTARQPAPIPTTAAPTPSKEKPMPVKPKCEKCGKELRSDNTKGICADAVACRERRGADGVMPAADKVIVSKQVKASPDGQVKPATEGPVFFFGSLTNEQLAAHLRAGLAEREKRLAGLDVLRTVVKD